MTDSNKNTQMSKKSNKIISKKNLFNYKINSQAEVNIFYNSIVHTSLNNYSPNSSKLGSGSKWLIFLL